MTDHVEIHRKAYTISTDPSRLDVDAIAEMLSHSYWAASRSRENLERALFNSLVFGLYDGSRQIGLARVVTDSVRRHRLAVSQQECLGSGHWI